MYIDLYDFTSPWCEYPANSWQYFNITPQDCRRRKGPRSWAELDILLPEVKEAFPFCRFNVHLHVPNFFYLDDLFSAVSYTRYAIPDDMQDRCAFHNVFCTDEEMAEFIRLRYPKDIKTAADIQKVLTMWRNQEYRYYKTGELYPNIDIPEPYKTRLYSGEFDKPWTPIHF